MTDTQLSYSMDGVTRNTIENIGSGWKKTRDGGRTIRSQGIVEIPS